MRTRITPTFVVKSWDEKSWHEGTDGRKLTRATMVYTYTGDMEGESRIESVMCYRDKTWASFVGIEHFVGTINGRTGSCVFQGSGIFDNGVARSTSPVVAGSGVDGLQGLSGELRFEAGHLDRYPIVLEYEFEV